MGGYVQQMVRKPKAPAAHLRSGGFLPAGSATKPAESEDDGQEIAIRNWQVAELVTTIPTKIFQHKPSLVEPIVGFVRSRSTGLEVASVRSFIKRLQYLEKFVNAYEQSYGIGIYDFSDFSTQLMRSFRAWLEGTSDVRPKINERGKVSKLTIAPTYNFIRDLLLWVKAELGVKELEDIAFETNVGKGGAAQSQPRRSLRDDEVARIRKACTTELASIFAMLKEGRTILEDDTITVPDLGAPAPAFKDFKVCLKAYKEFEEMRLPYRKLASLYPGLARAVRAPPYHSLGKLLPLLHFTPRTLIPVIVMAAMHTCFEPDTLLGVKRDEIRDSSIFGKQRLNIVGTKKRGGRRLKTKSHARGDKSPFSLPAVIDELLKSTAAAAERVGSDCKALFCYVRRTGDFGFFKESSAIDYWLKDFIAEHDLPDFCLSNLRKSGADRADKVTDGDVAAQKKAMAHERISTTLRSYQSDASIARRAEGLAQLQNVRGRRLRSGGKIETREQELNNSQKLAATPGFYCHDAYDSPVKDEVKGRLCGAYGKCAGCPLAFFNPNSARDYFRLEQVQAELLRCRTAMDPSRWLAHWQPQLLALETEVLPFFSDEIRLEARSLSLPPIPRIE